MKLQIELKDEWIDQTDLQTALRKTIVRDVVVELRKHMKEKIDDAILHEVKSQVESSFYRNIQAIVTEVVQTGELNIGSTNAPKMKSLKDYIIGKFNSNNNWGSPEAQIKKLAEAHGIELKKRYDLIYASHIVAKLGENGLLQKDVAQLLIGENKQT